MCLRQSFLQLDSVIAMEDMIVRFVLLIVMVGAGVLLIWSARAAASGGAEAEPDRWNPHLPDAVE